ELLHLAHRIREIASHGIQLRELLMGGSEIRIALQSLLELGERLRIPMCIHQRNGVIRVHDGRKGVERQRETEFLERLIESLFRNEKGKGVEIVSCSAIGI